MSEFEVLEYHQTFEAASARAKEFACIFLETTSVDRCESGWMVLVSPEVKTQFLSQGCDVDGYSDDDDDGAGWWMFAFPDYDAYVNWKDSND